MVKGLESVAQEDCREFRVVRKSETPGPWIVIAGVSSGPSKVRVFFSDFKRRQILKQARRIQRCQTETEQPGIFRGRIVD